MRLIGADDYIGAAERLADLNTLALSRKVLFVSTEDPGVIDSVRRAALTRGRAPGLSRWTHAWSELYRSNSNGVVQVKEAAGEGMSAGALTHLWWLQLLLALEADAWVGTRGSNWNRLIDELRCVWVPKCKGVYWEVGLGKDWTDYQW